MDLMIPQIDGYEMALLLEQQHAEVKIMILSVNTAVDMTYNLIEKTGIKGYLPKSSNKHILWEVTRSVHKHNIFIHEAILKADTIPRALDIVQLICKGLSNK
ncbi:MAG: hypothetical protein BGO31_03430 [Bacteroidetes bacterium 43-16]|nr:MAG: hypothetical protein BGO31_03430 [Bacteroidetes bacterium 43-16]